MKKIITLTVLFLISFATSFAQKDRSNYEEMAKWYLNINAGATWHTTDVKNKTNSGLGFVIGRSFNYNYGKALGFDLRFRYLGGAWIGQDHDTTGFNPPNVTLSNGATNYQSSLGYSVLNFKTFAHNFDLEFAIHLNRLREKSGWDPYLFGGVGLTLHRTFGNLVDTDEMMYAYNTVDQPFNKNNLATLMDKTYESSLDGSTNGYNVGLLPSLGIGIAYQFSPVFSLGIEHKTYFSRADLFDGYANPAGTIKNDWFHYTNFYLKFRFKTNSHASGSTYPNNPGNEPTRPNPTPTPVPTPTKPTKPTTDRTPTPDRTPTGYPPIITYTNPNTSPRQVNSDNFTIQARIDNVDVPQNITMEVNGRTFNGFNFNASTKVLQVPISLLYGTNTVRIKAINNYGSDDESVQLIYERRYAEPAPDVYFIDPSTSPYRTDATTFNLRAKALNVASKQDIIFKQNGVVNYNFTFNASNKDFSSSVVLSAGNNVFEIIGSNAVGTDNATTIIVNNRSTAQPPIVSITNPPSTPYSVNNENFVVFSNVYNVTSSNQIQVFLNGTSVPFTYNESSKIVQSTIRLQRGTNNVRVYAKNTAGTDEQTVAIIYQQNQTIQPPVVTFTQPTQNNANTTIGNQIFSAHVTNVTTRDQIQVKYNGNSTNNFTFESATNTVTLNTNLVEGANYVEIKGTNQAGTDEKTRTVYYKKREILLPPTITYVQPIENPTTVYNVNYTVSARIENINSAANLALKINGVSSTQFTYSASSRLMNFDISLMQGANSVEITATNNSGQDIESTTIIYREQTLLKKPEVTIFAPTSERNYETSIARQLVKATILNVENSSKIFISVNNQAVTNFDYDQASKTATLSLSLNEGMNHILISGVNEAGTANDELDINYKKMVIRLLPVITYLTPAQPNGTTASASYVMRASIENVDRQEQLKLEKDGQNKTDFSYNVSSKILTFNTTLVEGKNHFNIIAQNESGSVSSQTDITYNKPEPECLKPILTKNQTRSMASSKQRTISIATQHINGIEAFSYSLNGVALNNGAYNAASQTFTVNVTLEKGQNTFVLIAKNNCGSATITEALTFIELTTVKVPLPCISPEVQIITPASNVTVEQTTYVIKANVTNVKAENQITFKVNNTVKPFTYDVATQVLSATVALSEGINQLNIQVSNDCGSASDTRTITRYKCEKPVITQISSSAQSGTTVYAQSFSFKGSISNIENASQLVVSHNNTSVNFVYNAATNTIDLDRPLSLGTNTIQITAKNTCGSAIYTHTVTRRNDPNAQPPVIEIVDPQNTIVVTSSAYSVKINTQFVTAAYQAAVTVNGQNKSFTFNPSDGSMQLNVDLSSGENVIVATAITNFGTSTSTKTIVYNAQKRELTPSIVLTNPSVFPATMSNGVNTIRGTIKNCTAISQLSLMINNIAVDASTTKIVGNDLEFTLVIQMSPLSGNKTLDIRVATPQGNQQKSVSLIAPKISIKIPATKPTISQPTKPTPTPAPVPPTRTPMPEIKTPTRTSPTPIIRNPR